MIDRPADGSFASLTVEGPTLLSGKATISGFKHALVTTVAASLTSESKLTLANCPDIAETRVLKRLVELAGGRVERCEDRLILDPADMVTGGLDPGLAGQIHGAVYLLPGLVRRFGAAVVKVNGGCQIGSADGGRRPVEHYQEIFLAFGAGSELRDGDLHVSSTGFTACDIDLSRYTAGHPSQSGNLYSGATKMALLCAACAEGTSRLAHPYDKADVVELIAVLRKLGVKISALPDGTTLSVERAARTRVDDVFHELIPDLVEIVTWIAAASLYGDSPFELVGAGMARAAEGLRAEIDLFRRMGIDVASDGDRFVVHPPVRMKAIDVTVGHTDCIFSDSHPFFALLAASAEGRTQIEEQVWPDRFGYVAGLRQLGVSLHRDGSSLYIDGLTPPRRRDQTVEAPDLRAGAVLLLAALGVPGRTVVTGTAHLQRGYADLPAALRSCGANVWPCAPTVAV